MQRKRGRLVWLLTLVGAAGLLFYLWPHIFGGLGQNGALVPQPAPAPAQQSSSKPATPSPPIQGDVSISFDDSTSAGDVHIHTADGLYYDLQLVGEFTALKSVTDDLEIQVRQGPWQGSSKTVSTNTAVAMNVAGDRVGIYAGKNFIYINGQATPITGAPIALAKGGAITPSSGRISVTWPDQTTAQVSLNGSYLDLVVELADSRIGKVTGLFGNFDRNPVNDLTTRDGSVIEGPAPTESPGAFQQRLYQRFGNSWRIRQPDSLFVYGPGESTETWTDLHFPYQIVSTQGLDPGIRQRAEDACKLAGITVSQFLENCILDIATTGEALFARSMAQIEAAVKLTAGLECRSLSSGGDKCTDYQPSLPGARVGSQYRFTIETMVGNAKQVETFDCSLIDASRRASCRIRTKGDVFEGGATVASFTLDTGELHEDRGVMRRR